MALIATQIFGSAVADRRALAFEGKFSAARCLIEWTKCRSVYIQTRHYPAARRQNDCSDFLPSIHTPCQQSGAADFEAQSVVSGDRVLLIRESPRLDAGDDGAVEFRRRSHASQ